MSKFLVAGFFQHETIVKVDSIPISYANVTSRSNTIYTNVGGDAYNESLALKWLGNSVDYMAMIGKYELSDSINWHDNDVKLYVDYVLPKLEATPTAVIFCDENGKQQIFEDTKNIREMEYDTDIFKERVERADMVVVSNCNFCRPLLPLAKAAGKKIAVNIHDYKDEKLLDNRDFVEAADIIYLSDDHLTMDHYEFVKEIVDRYEPEVVILGEGRKGVLLYSRNEDIFANYKTVKTNEIVNTIGAGNALFSCFLHYYNKTGKAVPAIKNALLFASYKIGFMGTSNGFMTEEQIEQWGSLIWRDSR